MATAASGRRARSGRAAALVRARAEDDAVTLVRENGMTLAEAGPASFR